jgi:hypothetical protein
VTVEPFLFYRTEQWTFMYVLCMYVRGCALSLGFHAALREEAVSLTESGINCRQLGLVRRPDQAALNPANNDAEGRNSKRSA